MINNRLEDLEKGSFLARFADAGEGCWVPRGARMRDLVKLRLQGNRKGVCVEATLSLDARLFGHPVLDPLAVELVESFLRQGEWERPVEAGSARWIKETGAVRLKGKGGVLARHQEGSSRCFTVASEGGFLSKWLGK